MNPPVSTSFRPDGVPKQVPVLTAVVPAAEVSAALSVALDARLAEKQALMDLSGELMQALRPELERMTADLVHRTLEGFWQKRAEKYQNPSN